MPQHYDVIVVGGGTIGLSAACYAASRGLSTALFEQMTIHNDVASSKGLERIFRILYATQARVRLVESSYAMWREIEDYVGYELLKPSPSVLRRPRQADRGRQHRRYRKSHAADGCTIYLSG